MCPELPHRLRGFALPAAIFVMVVLSALAAFAASLSSLQHMGLALDAQGARAYQAARAGLEWGMYQTLKAATSSCSATGSEVALSADSLRDMTVTVRCVAGSTEDGRQTHTVTAWACNRPAATSPKCPGNAAVDTYVERKLSAVVEK